MKNLSVLAIPAKENKKDNPYNYILYSNIERLGVKVAPYNLRTFLNVKSYDVVHFHWPEHFLNAKSTAGVYKAFIVFLSKLFFLKFFNKKIAWTVHNLAPHEYKNPFLLSVFYRILYKRMDGFIGLTNYSSGQIKAAGKAASQKITVIPHPHYMGYYPNNIGKQEAREQLNIPQDKFVFLFIGQVRAYKNVIGLAEAFKQLQCSNSVLVIAGRVHEDVADDLEQVIKGEDRIKVFPSFIHDNDLQLYLNCADLVVNPFHKILNSGSVFLNLSFYRPTLVPSTGSLIELQQQTGASWIKTFEGKLTAEHLKNCMMQIKNETPNCKPDLSKFDWNKIAQQTKSFYESLLVS